MPAKIISKLKKVIFLPEPPEYLTLQEWDEYVLSIKKKYPIKHFIYHVVVRNLRSAVYRIYDFFYYIESRYIKKHHHIKIDVKRFLPMHEGFSGTGIYYDMDHDEKILYACFQILVDYIEKDVGLDRLEELENSLFDYEREYYQLYDWWINKRPLRNKLRPKPEDYGLSHDAVYADPSNCTPEEKQYIDDCRKWTFETKAEHRLEDTKMLVRLMVNRSYLWV